MAEGSEHKLVFPRVNKNLGIDMTDIEEDPRRARCGTGSAAVPSWFRPPHETAFATKRGCSTVHVWCRSDK